MSYSEDGYVIHSGAASKEVVENLRKVLTSDDDRAGQRNVLHLPEISALAKSSVFQELAEICVGAPARPIRGIFFDKKPGANWKVPFHQDRTIAVEKRIDFEGYTAWSVKDGVHHVRPPVEVLRKTVALRLHLDPCTNDNGALRVVPKSHALGSIPSSDVERIVRRFGEVVLEVDEGDVILMSPLLLHASSPAAHPSHRRVLHIEYSSALLPPGLAFPSWSMTPERVT